MIIRTAMSRQLSPRLGGHVAGWVCVCWCFVGLLVVVMVGLGVAPFVGVVVGGLDVASWGPS